MIIHNAAITGSLTYNGIDISDITGSEASVAALNSFSASINTYTSSMNSYTSSMNTYTGSTNSRLSSLETTTGSLINASASFSTRVSSLETFSSSILTYTGSTNSRLSSIESTTGSLNTFSGSTITRLNALETTSASLNTYTGSATGRLNALESTSASLNTFTGSATTRLNSLESKTGSYATTGSNTFVGAQYISDVSNAISFTSTSSLYSDGGLRITKDMYVSGTAYFNNVTVFGTQSVEYITSSQLNISDNIISVNTATPSVRFGGLAVYDSGSTGLTGSILWDSENNHWVYTNPSGSSYSGGMLISGPRNSSGLGNEVGTTCNAIMKGQGGDHITSSGIFDYGTAACFYGNSYINSSGAACFASTICTPTLVVNKSNPVLYINAGNSETSTIGFTQPAVSGYNGFIKVGTGLGDRAMTFGLSAAGTNNDATELIRLDDSGVTCFSSGVCATQLTSTVSSGINLELNKSSGPSIQFNKTGATAQGWQIAADPNFRILDSTASSDRFIIYTSGIAYFACQVCVGGNITANGALNGFQSGTHNLLIDWSAESQVTTLTNTNLFFGTNAQRRATIFSSGIACFACQVCAPTLAANNCINIGTDVSLGSRLSIQSCNDQAGITMYNSYDCNKWSLRTGTTGINNKGFGIVDDICNATRIQIDGAGNIGIGTLLPCSLLHLCSVSNSTIRVESACDQAGLRLIAGVPGTARASRIDFLNGATCVGRPQWTIINDYNQNGTNDLTFVSCDPLTKVLQIFQSGITCFACQVCAPVAIFSGCVGIGTTAPNAPLHVIKDLGVSTTAVLRLRGSNSTARTTRLQFEDYNGTLTDGLIDFVIPTAGCATGARLDIGVDSTMMSLVRGGNVGIGTSNPATTLFINRSGVDANWGTAALFNSATHAADVGSVLTFGGFKCLQTTSCSIFAKIAGLKENGTGGDECGYLSFSINNNSTYVERARITSRGNVGIGTTCPVATNLIGSMTIVKSYNGDTPTSTTAQTYDVNQSNLYLFGRNASITMVGNANEESIIGFGNPYAYYIGGIRYDMGSGTTGGDMKFQTGGTNERLRIFNNGIACFSCQVCAPVALISGCVGINNTSPSYTLHAGGRGYFFATNQDAGWGMLTLDYGNGTNSNIYAIQMAEGGGINAAVGFGSYSSSNCGDLVMWANNGSGLVERSRIYYNGAAKIAVMDSSTTTILQKSFNVSAGACINVCFDIFNDIPGKGSGYVMQADIHVGGYGSAGASALLYKASVAGYDGHHVGIGSYHKDAELVKCASGVDVKIYNPAGCSCLLGITIYNCSGTYVHVGTMRMVLTY